MKSQQSKKKNFLIQTLSTCFQASAASQSTEMNINSNSNFNSNNNNNNLNSLKDSLMSRIRRSLFVHADDHNQEDTPTSPPEALKTLMSEIEQLKSSNSDLWLQIQEILGRDKNESGKTPSLVVKEHIYENLCSQQDVGGDEENLEEVKPSQRSSNRVAEKIERFNQLATSLDQKQVVRAAQNQNKNDKKRWSYSINDRVRVCDTPNEKTTSVPVTTKVNSSSSNPVETVNSMNDYESMVRIKESIEKSTRMKYSFLVKFSVV